MTPEDVLSHPPRALSQAQREFCFENGYLAVERFASFSTPALPPTPFPYAASRSVVALWPGGAWEARPLGAPRPVPLPHSSTLVRRLHFHIRCPDRRGQGRAGSEFMEKTMRKRFESPPGPDSPRRESRSRRAVRAVLRDRDARDAACRLYRAGTGGCRSRRCVTDVHHIEWPSDIVGGQETG